MKTNTRLNLVPLRYSLLCTEEPASHLLPSTSPNRPISEEVNNALGIYADAGALYGHKAEVSLMDYFLANYLRQGTHSNCIFKFPVFSLCFPCVFPVQWQIFPVPIYIICDYYIVETDLADLSNFWGKNGNTRGKYRSILYL